MSAFACETIARRAPDVAAMEGMVVLSCDEPLGPVSVSFLARTTVCPECERVLTISEVIECFCERCGTIAPREVMR